MDTHEGTGILPKAACSRRPALAPLQFQRASPGRILAENSVRSICHPSRRTGDDREVLISDVAKPTRRTIPSSFKRRSVCYIPPSLGCSGYHGQKTVDVLL
jgi:hypothetical protein